MKTYFTALIFFITSISFAQNSEWITFDSENSPLPSNFILSTCFDWTNNTMWVGTFGHQSYGIGGIVTINTSAIFDTSSWQLYNTGNSNIGNNLSWSIVIDSSGNKWVNCAMSNFPSIQSKLSKYSQNTWSTFSYPAFWAANINSRDIASDKFNNIWIAISSSSSPGGGGIIPGRFAMYNGSAFSQPNIQYPSRNLQTIAVDKNNVKWIGTYVDASGYGIMRYNDTTTTIFNGNNIPPLNGTPFNVKTIKVSPTNEKWIGTEFGLLRYNDVQWTLYNQLNSGIPSNFIQSIAFEGNIIWIGTLNGLAKFDGNNNWQVFDTTNSDIPSGVVEAISIDNFGNKWLGTRDFSNPYGLTIFKEGGIVGLASVSNEIPKNFKLYNNYPNPFNPSTKIKFDIPNANTNTKLIVYDALGREIRTLINQDLQAGTYEIDFDANSLSSGIYFYRILAGSSTETKKMLLVK